MDFFEKMKKYFLKKKKINRLTSVPKSSCTANSLLKVNFSDSKLCSTTHNNHNNNHTTSSSAVLSILTNNIEFNNNEVK